MKVILAKIRSKFSSVNCSFLSPVYFITFLIYFNSVPGWNLYPSKNLISSVLFEFFFSTVPLLTFPLSSSKASIFRASWIADYSDAENFLSLFYSKNFSPYGPNYTHFSNKLYDNLYNKLYDTNDKSTRIKLYNQMDSIIVNNFVVIPLYYDQIIRLTQKNVENLNLNKMNILNLETVKLN